jgi:hypothetical protein
MKSRTIIAGLAFALALAFSGYYVFCMIQEIQTGVPRDSIKSAEKYLIARIQQGGALKRDDVAAEISDEELAAGNVLWGRLLQHTATLDFKSIYVVNDGKEKDSWMVLGFKFTSDYEVQVACQPDLLNWRIFSMWQNSNIFCHFNSYHRMMDESQQWGAEYAAQSAAPSDP